MDFSNLQIPRWFELSNHFAGAVRDVSLELGIRGWIVDLDNLDRTFSVSIVCEGQTIAEVEGRAADPEIERLIGVPTTGGFQILWGQFDIMTVRRLAECAPRSEVHVRVRELGVLSWPPSSIHELNPLTIGTIIAYCDRSIRYLERFQFDASDRPGDIYRSEPSSQSVDVILKSGLFDVEYYSGVAGLDRFQHVSESIAAHYLYNGEQQGYKPNPLFDPFWYRHKYMTQTMCVNALYHYITVGENNGHKPCSVFETSWYKRKYLCNLGNISPLRHFLQANHLHRFNPNEYFDIKYYIRVNKDLINSNIDAFSHWLGWGVFEGRSGSLNFNAEYIWRRYLGNKREINPFEKFMDIGVDLGWEPTPSTQSSTHRAAAASSEPGPSFERLEPIAPLREDAPKIVAMYLPQFHSIPENDAWWGEGFTEWRNLVRAIPRYVGHVQPRIPRDLGFYELNGSRTMRRQIEFAKHGGVHGFCFYYYNFNGHRLLEQPVETFLRESDIDFPFCIMWANENWTRRWDGMDQEILIRQNYRHGDAPALVADIARHMKDPRYIRTVEGRPYFFIYRADIIPDCAQMLAQWRDMFRSEHNLEPLFFVCQTFGIEDPRPFGADGALEFPPHKLTKDISLLNSSIDLLDPEFSGQVFDYRDIVDASIRESGAAYPLIKTAFPNWDNSARRQNKAMSIANSTPSAFQEWMSALIQNADGARCFGDAVVFVNAWNEWCEGAYLEPDTHFGFAYLNAMRRAIGENVREVTSVTLIGHDAFPAGAQHLLLALGKLLKRQFGIKVSFVLLEGGALAEAYSDVAETYIASNKLNDRWAGLRFSLGDLFRRGFRYAICNTVAAGGVTSILDEFKFEYCSLVHELPTVIRSRALAETYTEMLNQHHAVVYPNLFVKNALDADFGFEANNPVIIPQGLYNVPLVPPDARVRVRESLGLPQSAEIVINIGYGDFRKGVDLFLSIAEQVFILRPNVYFVWIGDIHPDLSSWLSFDIARRSLRNLLMVPYDKDIGRYLGAADVFFSTSREDPFPSVILEALSVGIPVMAFQGTGGHAELLAQDSRLGVLAPFADIKRSAELIVDVLCERAEETSADIGHRKKLIDGRYNFALFGSNVLKLVEPHYRTISVIVPNYNYGNYLPARFDSIFNQMLPVLEIVVLDDASTDNSLQVVSELQAQSKRTISVRTRDSNSGNPFRQWKSGLDEALGEFVWIAEADDVSHPRFLAEAIRRLRQSPDAAFCFSDSKAIGGDGASLFPNYKSYYAENGDQGLETSARFTGEEFVRRFLAICNVVVNASAVVWRTDVLREVFRRLGERAFEFRCAGDWRIYVEACSLGKDILYIADPLNIHRRHDQSVTHTLDKIVHLREIMAVQTIALDQIEASDSIQDMAAAWRTKTARQWLIDPQSISLHKVPT